MGQMTDDFMWLKKTMGCFVHFDSKNNDNSCIILKVLKEGFRFKAKRLYNNFCWFVLFCNVYCVCADFWQMKPRVTKQNRASGQNVQNTWTEQKSWKSISRRKIRPLLSLSKSRNLMTKGVLLGGAVEQISSCDAVNVIWLENQDKICFCLQKWKWRGWWSREKEVPKSTLRFVTFLKSLY